MQRSLTDRIYFSLPTYLHYVISHLHMVCFAHQFIVIQEMQLSPSIISSIQKFNEINIKTESQRVKEEKPPTIPFIQQPPHLVGDQLDPPRGMGMAKKLIRNNKWKFCALGDWKLLTTKGRYRSNNISANWRSRKTYAYSQSIINLQRDSETCFNLKVKLWWLFQKLSPVICLKFLGTNLKTSFLRCNRY